MSWQCPRNGCAKSFASKYSMERHFQKVDCVPENPYHICYICGERSFDRASRLKRHRKNVHGLVEMEVSVEEVVPDVVGAGDGEGNANGDGDSGGDGEGNANGDGDNGGVVADDSVQDDPVVGHEEEVFMEVDDPVVAHEEEVCMEVVVSPQDLAVAVVIQPTPVSTRCSQRPADQAAKRLAEEARILLLWSLTTRKYDTLWLSIVEWERDVPVEGGGVQSVTEWTVRTRVPFNEGDPVIQYSGRLVDRKVGNSNSNPYVFDFLDKRGRAVSIDAKPPNTQGDGRPGMFINHSKTNPNLIARRVYLDNDPRIFLFAKRDIGIDEDIRFDYGDRSQASLERDKWLAE